MINEPVVILANGNYPTHPIPLQKLNEAGCIICCDGAVDQLEGLEPDIIIGDLDSIDHSLNKKYIQKIIHLPEQDENDLQKAIRWVEDEGIKEVAILGATGKRDDHSLSNIFILLQFPTAMKCKLYSDHGIFSIAFGLTEFQSFPGQQVSIFSADPKIEITSINLKYNLKSTNFTNLYSGSLNESIAEVFTLSLSHGKILTYQVYE
jgi:thiamine pyrophosphokinase